MSKVERGGIMVGDAGMGPAVRDSRGPSDRALGLGLAAFHSKVCEHPLHVMNKFGRFWACSR